MGLKLVGGGNAGCTGDAGNAGDNSGGHNAGGTGSGRGEIIGVIEVGDSRCGGRNERLHMTRVAAKTMKISKIVRRAS
jgi:hypothetical protein